MPSTYSPNLRIELIASGEQSGTWGTTTNSNLGTLIEDAISGYVSVSITSADQALTALDGAADQSRNMVVNLTTTTAANFNVYIPPAEKFYVIRNTTAFNATIFCSTVLGNTTAAGLGVTVLANTTTIIFSDGTNVRVAIDSFSGSSLVAANLTVNGNTTLGDAIGDTVTINGTTTFAGAGNRILGDFSNATVANRVMFQSSTVNGATNVLAIPNGTSVIASIGCFDNSDTTNASFGQLRIQSATDVRFNSSITGTGTYLPMTFHTGGSEAARIDTSRNVLVGGTAARGTTVGSAHLDLFNGTAPAGTLTNGISLYSASGDFNFMDSAGNGYKVGYRNVPPVGTKTSSYTLAVADVGKYVQVGTGGSITIPDATFAEGDAVSIFNNTTGNVTITCTITTAYIAGTDSDKATVTLSTRGVATVLFISGTVCVITGNVS
jgi:hypothetical protein